MNARVWRILVCAASLVVLPAGAAEVYRWVDAEGGVHYTEHPPESRDATRMHLKKSAPAQPVAPASPPRASAGAATKTSDAEAAAKEEAERQQAERLQVHCANVRKNIEQLRTRPAARYPREDGSYQRYSDEERERMIADAEEFLQANCD